jgi:hypothetical protein
MLTVVSGDIHFAKCQSVAAVSKTRMPIATVPPEIPCLPFEVVVVLRECCEDLSFVFVDLFIVTLLI